MYTVIKLEITHIVISVPLIYHFFIAETKTMNPCMIKINTDKKCNIHRIAYCGLHLLAGRGGREPTVPAPPLAGK